MNTIKSKTNKSDKTMSNKDKEVYCQETRKITHISITLTKLNLTLTLSSIILNEKSQKIKNTNPVTPIQNLTRQYFTP